MLRYQKHHWKYIEGISLFRLKMFPKLLHHTGYYVSHVRSYAGLDL